MEPWKRERTYNYAEDSEAALVARPADEDELRHVILRARALGKRITVQAGQQGLDRQALPARGEQVVVVMDAFDRIEVEEPADRSRDAWVTCGAGARWGDILRACEARGLVPYVVVTSSHCSIGGTVAADCLSRFTSDFGKESKLVSRLRLMTADGAVVELEREVEGSGRAGRTSPPIGELHPILGVIGGFGLLGVVTEVRFLAHRVEDQGERPLAVRSIVRKYDALMPLLEALMSRAYKLIADRSYRNPKALYAVASYTDDPAKWMNILITSYFVRADPERGRRMPQHQSDSMLRPIGEWLKRVPGFTPLFWANVYRFFGRRYVDPVFDYTFFMDGNVRTKDIERAVNVRTKVRQQTYLIPAPPRPSERTFDPRPAYAFFMILREHLRARNMTPILLDVLFVPEDDAYLSGSRGMSALAITVAFEPLSAKKADQAEAALCALAERAAQLGGRVHLTKRVCATPELVAGAYGDGLVAMAKLRDALDPQRVFDSAFAERVLRPAARLKGVEL